MSYIVFSDRCELKSVPREGARWRVLHRDGIIRRVQKDLESMPIIFDEATFEATRSVIEKLASASTTSARADHAADVHRASTGTVCPRCGGNLRERNGRYGPFLGCSNYPRCRFTRDL